MAQKKQKLPDVKVGQTWIDNDKRQGGTRKVTVIKVVKAKGKVEAYAVCNVYGRGAPRSVKIKLRRFKPTSTGYRLEGTVLQPGESVKPEGVGFTVQNAPTSETPVAVTMVSEPQEPPITFEPKVSV